MDSSDLRPIEGGSPKFLTELCARAVLLDPAVCRPSLSNRIPGQLLVSGHPTPWPHGTGV